MPKMEEKDPPSGQKCGGCGEDLRCGSVLATPTALFHSYCFKCAHCDRVMRSRFHPVASGEADGGREEPYCQSCFQREQQPTCETCSCVLESEGWEARPGRLHHLSCLKCGQCGAPFAADASFYTIGAELLHPACAVQRRLDANVRVASSAPVRPKPYSPASPFNLN